MAVALDFGLHENSCCCRQATATCVELTLAVSVHPREEALPGELLLLSSGSVLCLGLGVQGVPWDPAELSDHECGWVCRTEMPTV